MKVDTIHNIDLTSGVKEIYNRLKALKTKNDRVAFDKTMAKILPGLKMYVSRWLENAIITKRVPKGKYSADDFVDDLYLIAYDHFQEVKEDKNIYRWLFEKADKLLEDTEVEEDFDDFFFKNIDNYTKGEWDEMEENYSIDGGGHVVMEDQLDDSSYYKNNYELLDVFVEDKDKEIIEDLNGKLNEERINRHIDMVSSQLSSTIRSIFDLYSRHQFSIEDIAIIKKIPIHQVESYIMEAKKIIRVSLGKRFSGPSL